MSLYSRVRAAVTAFRTLEDPRTSLSSPANWLVDAVGGTPSSSGVRVTEKTALAYSAAFACINVLSKDVGQLPAQLFQRNGLDRELASAHPVYRLVHDRPNPLMTPFTFKQTITSHVVGWGNGYAEIETTNGGKPVALWPLMPNVTRPVVKDGRRSFVTTLPNGQDIGLPSERVLHIPGFGFDGLKGYSVIQLAREAIGSGIAAEQYSSGFFKRGAIPGVVLKHPGPKLSPEARKNIKESWKMQHEGLDNAHRTALLEEGVTIERIGLSQQDAQFLDTSKFSIEQVARFFDMPLMRLHSTTPITSWGTGLEQWNRGYLTHTLGPWLTLWEESLNWSLLNESERPSFYVEFLREALLEGDTAAKTQQLKDMFGIGVMSPNQIARKLNLPSFGPDGDTHFVPLNFVPIDLAMNPPDIPTAPPDDPSARERRDAESRAGRQRRAAIIKHRLVRAQEPAIKRAAERYVRQETQAVRSAMKKAAGARSIADFQAAMEAFYRTLPESIRREMSPVLRGYFLMLTDALEDETREFTEQERQQLDRALKQFEDDLIAKHIRVSTDGLRKKIADATGDGVWDDLGGYVDEWDTTRAAKIATFTAVDFSGQLSRVAYGLVGITRMLNMKVTGVACPVCDPLNGQVAHGTPPNHGGCSCVLVAG